MSKQIILLTEKDDKLPIETQYEIAYIRHFKHYLKKTNQTKEEFNKKREMYGSHYIDPVSQRKELVDLSEKRHLLFHQKILNQTNKEYGLYLDLE